MTENYIKPIVTKNISDDDETSTVEDEPLSPAARLFQSPGLNFSVMIVLGSNTLIDANTLKYGFMDSIAKHPRFAGLLVTDDENGGQMSWRRTKLDIHEHVYTPDLNPNMELANNFVEEYISNLSITGFDLAKPLWELHILNVKTSDANATAILKLHHSIGDAISIMSLFLASSRKASDLDSMPSVPKTKTPTSLCRNNCNGITMAGISRYLNEKYAPGSCEYKKDQRKISKKDNNLPANIRLKSNLIYNLRPSTVIESSAAMMEKKKEVMWGNKFGFILLPITIALQDDPLDYVRKAKAIVDRKKLSFEAICSIFIGHSVFKLLGFKKYAALMYKISSNTTMAFSNIVGPGEEISFYGHHLSYIAPTVYGQPQALTVHWQSYGEKMIFVLTVDPDVIPDYKNLAANFETSLKLIKDAVIQRGVAVPVQAETMQKQD